MSNLEKYDFIVSKENVCGGRPTIKGTRIEPWHIANYGTVDEIAKDFSLTQEQVKKAIIFYRENKDVCEKYRVEA